MSGNLEKTQRERGYELNELNELSPVCIICRQPVERGQPGTGALAGADLHTACFEKANGKIGPAKVAPQDAESTRVDAEERAAIQEEDNYPIAVAQDEDPLHEFDAWIRGES